MPNPALNNLRDAAILWPKAGEDGYGQPTLSYPREIRCRWTTSESDEMDGKGTRIKVDATAIVDQVIAVGSELWLGEMDEWVGTGTGQDRSTKVMVVKTYNEVSGIRGRYVTRTIGMMKKAATRNEVTSNE